MLGSMMSSERLRSMGTQMDWGPIRLQERLAEAPMIAKGQNEHPMKS